MVVGTKEPTTYHAQRMSDMHTYDGRCCFITILSNMHVKKNEAGNLLPMVVTEGVMVNVLQNVQHEYLMTTKEVASGYGVSPYSIRSTSSRNSSELQEGKHFIKGIAICNTQPHQVFWTKRGIVRLGFFIKSERAKLFRDWAEELIINVADPLPDVKKMIDKPKKTKANRLTQERLLDIMADACKIDDKELRLKISNKLMGGREL